MSFARLFYRESKQDLICKCINSIAKDKMEEETIITGIPEEFGKKFLIGSKIQRKNNSENCYYHFRFIDDLIDPNMRFIRKGILEVNKYGKLTILDNDFYPMPVKYRFIFGYGMLELHTQERADHFNKMDHSNHIVNVAGCLITAAAVGVAAYNAYKIR